MKNISMDINYQNKSNNKLIYSILGQKSKHISFVSALKFYSLYLEASLPRIDKKNKNIHL